jgi:arylsulfatase A-like enzyme
MGNIRITRILLVILIPVFLGQAKAADHPNIVLIVSDNQTSSLLGAYGNEDILTPNIDRLAAEGMRFDRAYAASGVCSPSRASLLTGLIPSQTGIHNGLPARFGGIEDWAGITEFRNLPQTLADAGYNTGLVGKYHLGVAAEPQIGFQYWVTFPSGHTEAFFGINVIDNGETYHVPGHLTDFWSQKAAEFIADQDEDTPFFLYVPYNGPYNLPPLVTIIPNTRYAEYYRENVPAMPQEPVHPYLRNWVASQRSSDTSFLDSWDRQVPTGDGKTITKEYPTPGWGSIDALNNAEAMINVASEMSMIDDGVGAIMAALQEHGFDENTLVIFTADQGAAYGQHGLWGNTSQARPNPAYDQNMRIPLIIRQPGRIRAGTEQDIMVNQFDMLPTILDFLGFSDKEIANTPGNSFAPFLVGGSVPWDNTVFYEYINTRAIQTDEWKYVKRLLQKPNELYDMANDPGERVNLADDPQYQSVREELDAHMTAFYDRFANPRWDIWKGGTAKAVIRYNGDNSQYSQVFPNFVEPVIEDQKPFRD